METQVKPKQKKLQKFGKYVYYIQDKIGQGYSSSVYKGHKIEQTSTQDLLKSSKNPGYKVALKVMSVNYDSDFQKSIVEEQICILQRLAGQEYIISLLDVVTSKSQICLVTQYCQGGTLKKQIRKQKCLDQKRAMNYFVQLVKGYQKIFEANILHRDLKPDNILLKSDKIKIADFGFAIEEQAAKNQTFLVGSPVYMPLQTLKKNKYSHKGDIWALGVTLFQMIVGQYPYKAKSTKQLIKQISSISIRDIIPKKISGKVSQLLFQLLELDVEKRISFPELKKRLFPQEEVSKPIRQKQIGQPPNKIRIKFPSDIMYNSQHQKNTKQLKKSQVLPKATSLQQKKQEKQQIKQIKVESKSTASQQPRQKFTRKESKLKTKKQDSEILDILVSQLHFCRLMYKVHNRARIEEKRTKKKIISSSFRVQLFGFIFTKLEDLQNLNCLSTDKANEFTCSKYYPKLNQISKQYIERYQEELKNYQISKYSISKQNSFDSLDLIIQLQEQIKTIYDRVKGEEKFDHCVQIVILLDYLITILQLLKLLGRNGIESFHKHSKIQKIVEAEPIRQVRIEQFKAIQNKLKVLKLI